MEHTHPDTVAVDQIAALLGLAEEWDSAADYLEWIVDIVATVRPSPGAYEPEAYRHEFRRATGREVPPGWGDVVDEPADVAHAARLDVEFGTDER